MRDAFDHPRHDRDFKQISDLIQAELGLRTQFIQASSNAPMTSLSVELETRELGAARVANLMFLPVSQEVENIRLLQLYCESFSFGKFAQPINLETLFHSINQAIPIGSFSIDSEKQLIFKYVYALSSFTPLNSLEFLEVFLLWMYIQDSIHSLLTAVLTKQLTIKEAIHSLTT